MTFPKKPTELDQKISAALKYTADDIAPSAEAEDRLLTKIAEARAQKLNRTFAKENQFAIRLSKKMLLALCILFCMTAATTFAAGGIVGWSGHNLPLTETDSFSAVENKLLPKLEYQPNIIEEFANGYKFAEGHLGTSQAVDENFVKLGRVYTELCLYYIKPGLDGRINLYVVNKPSLQISGYDDIRKTGDITLYYTEQRYKFVPPDYQPTEADMAAEESGEITISYGSIDIEEKVFAGVIWQQDGVIYDLFGFDLEISADELFAMAEEVMSL